MKIKYILTQIITNYMKVDGEWQYIDVTAKYECINLDDLQNLILTLIECSTKAVKFEIEKVKVKEDERTER